VDALLPELARLPYLKAINFHGVRLSAAAFQRFCMAVAPRLLVLLFESARVGNAVESLTHVGLLHQLRVLVVDCPPPMKALLQLHRLEYLHVGRCGAHLTASTATALRHLSSSHALRSLSLGRDAVSMATHLVSTMPPADLDDADAAAPVDWTQPIHLTDLSFASCVPHDTLQRWTALPTLTRLQTGVGSYYDPVPPPLTIFVRLQQLRLGLYSGKWMLELARCSHLRVLQLRFYIETAVSAASLCDIVAANAATLEELRFSCVSGHEYALWPALEDGAAGAAKWSALVQCVRLRVLELPLAGTLTPHLLHALSKAPVFQSLELALTLEWQHKCSLQFPLLPSLFASASWCSVSLFLPEAATGRVPTKSSILASLPTAVGVTEMMPLSRLDVESLSVDALNRLRVFARCTGNPTERCYMLRKPSGGGPLSWQIEY
jgi:hypothetical protein